MLTIAVFTLLFIGSLVGAAVAIARDWFAFRAARRDYRISRAALDRECRRRLDRISMMERRAETDRLAAAAPPLLASIENEGQA